MRADREDTREQAARVEQTRADLAAALGDLERASRGHADLADVAAEARALGRALASRAKRPPPLDTSMLLGEISAAQRASARSDEWDDAVRAVRGAESALDLATYDLRTARGEDG